MITKMPAFTTVLLAMGAALLVADAASVDAGALITVTVDAPLYDMRASGEGGCDPAGCSGDLTRVSKSSNGIPFKSTSVGYLIDKVMIDNQASSFVARMNQGYSSSGSTIAVLTRVLPPPLFDS